MDDFKERFLAARRSVIEAGFKKLNDMQRKAVLATEGPLLILAGAGSGKTTVLINRVANLLKYGRASDSDALPEGADEDMLQTLLKGGPEAERAAALDPVEPWRILAITFTNKAADELKSRLGRMLGDAAEDLWACTFHSACVRMLRRDAEKLGFPSSFTIYDSSDSQSLAKKIVKELDLDEKAFPAKSVLAEISRAKDAGIGAGEYLKNAESSGDIRRIRIGKIYVEYMRRLFAAGAMDFDDLIMFTVKLLREDEETRSYWQRRFKYVLIDEYQDTNRQQYLFASLVSGGYGNICVVGDDDQSIYKFRGATIENILSFEDEYRNCRVIRLEQNYRSTGRILDAANAVIRNNMGRKGKELWTKNDRGEKIELYVADSENDEAQYVASKIMGEFGRGAAWSDHAVLYRMNAQSSQIEYAFKRSGIPYKVIGGTRFFDRAEVKDMLAYLCVISVHGDDLRLTRIINNPPRGIGAKSVETAQQIANESSLSLFDVIDRADSYPELSRSAPRMREFARLIKSLSEFAENNTPDLLLDELFEKSGYMRMLEERNTVEDDARAENIRELKTSMINFMRDSGDKSLAGFLADVALYTDIDSYDEGSDCVTMMTMHSAKGLEFETVFIVGMEETIFPSLRAIGEEDEMEEERRLCYVAVTRAKKKLCLVSARQRMIFGRTSANKVSRFVDEIPDELIDHKNIPKGFSYSERPSAGAYRSRPQPDRKIYAPRPVQAPKAAAPAADYSVGCRVRHRAFGTGTITKMTPMGGDFFIEILFDTAGLKKLMLRAAAPFMEKI